MYFKEEVYPILASFIESAYKPESIVDVGCGNGVLMDGFIAKCLGEVNTKPCEMKLFLVSSAIHAKHGIYSTEDRIRQMIKTLESIHKYAPGSKVFILDGGYKVPSDKELEVIKELSHGFTCFTESGHMKLLQASKSQDIVKNVSELIMYGAFLQNTHEALSEYDRVFKMSGRYTLNAMFNEADHDDELPVVSKRRPSQFSPEITDGAKWQYMSRLWSWRGSDTKRVYEVYLDMLNDMYERVEAGGYIDIEHLLYKHLGNVKEVPIIGIEGNIAPNGVRVSD